MTIIPCNIATVCVCKEGEAGGASPRLKLLRARVSFLLDNEPEKKGSRGIPKGDKHN